MFNYFTRSTNANASAKPTEVKTEATPEAAPADAPMHQPPVVGAEAVAVPEKKDEKQRAPSPPARASPTEAQWFTCIDFVRVDGSSDTPTNGQQQAPAAEVVEEKTPTNVPTNVPTTAPQAPAQDEMPLQKAKTEDSEDIDSEWQEVTMTAFRGDGPVAAPKAQAPVPISSSDSSSSSDSEDDVTPAAPSGDNAASGAPADPPATGQNTVLNIRAREQRLKEDQRKAELLAVGRAAEEQRNLLAAKALADSEAAHLRRAKEELEALAAEQARAVAAALEEEDLARRREQEARHQQAAAQAAPAPIGGEGSPVRLCDCLGASSGFHRQGCKLRK